MKISRKTFLKSTAILSGGMFFQGSKLLTSLVDDDNRFQTIKGNYGVFTQSGGTIGWFISDDALIVIDTQFPENAKNLMNGIRKKTSRDIDILFNTHHHADHTSGNPYLKPFSKTIVAHENCPILQRKRLAKPGEEDKLVYADTTFSKDYSVQIGKEKLTAFHYGPAHTGGDSVIHFENSNIVHIGDLVFHKVFPFINLLDDASFSGWIKYLEYVADKFDNDTTFIFGHGKSMDISEVTGKKKDLYVMRDYFSALVDFVQKQIADGKTEDEVAKMSSIPGVKDRKELWKGAMEMNLRQAYKEFSA